MATSPRIIAVAVAALAAILILAVLLAQPGHLGPGASESPVVEVVSSTDAASLPKAPGCMPGPGVVTADALNVRSEPETGKIIARLSRGATVEILRCEGNWVELGSGRWVHGDYLAPPASDHAPAR